MSIDKPLVDNPNSLLPASGASDSSGSLFSTKPLKRKASQPSTLSGGNKRPRLSSKPPQALTASTQELVDRRHELEARRYELEARRVTYLESIVVTAESPAPTLGAPTASSGPAEIRLRTVACDIWYHTASTEYEFEPVGCNLEDFKAADVAYQSSKHFKTFRHPSGTRLRCIPCL